MGMANVDGKDYIVDKVGRVNRDIEWKEGAVCYADGQQWFLNTEINKNQYQLSNENLDSSASFDWFLSQRDFQLNEPRQGDYIPKSELDTEQKYNDAVEVLGLFGISVHGKGFNYLRPANTLLVIDSDWEFIGTGKDDSELERKLTYNQLMAIGKLKRLMNERDNLKRWGEYSGCVQVDLGDVKEKQVAMQKNKPVVAQVMIDLTERMEIGIKTYGEALRANNGRDALQDAYEEALDLACYLKQAMIERDNANTN